MDTPKVKQIVPFSEKDLFLSDLAVYNKSDYAISPFDDLTIEFLDTFSKKTLSNKSINSLAEIAALGFWLRKNNLLLLKKENQHLFCSPKINIAPIGKVFHVCPANVDTMFMYSLTVSLLMGNKNVLRVSSRMDAPHVEELFKALSSVMQMEQFSVFANYINVISYPHNDEISNWISLNSNVRVIWGGDNTIRTFKKFETGPRTKDIVFADRVSVLCLDCKSYLGLDEKGKATFLRNFFNDAYTFDQMGCSSPQTIYFIGDKVSYETCIKTLQEDLSAFLRSNYRTDISSLSSLKLNRMVDDSIEDLVLQRSGDNYITFLKLSEKAQEATLHGCGGGYFYVKNVDSASQLRELQHKKVQTVSHFGLSATDMEELFRISRGEGIDRIVAIGGSLNFNYIWDGYNLFDELSKKIFIS